MMRTNMRNTSIPLLAPARKLSSNGGINSKKALLKPIPPKPSNSNEADTEKQPISDFPTPPVPIVSFLHGQPGEMIPLPQISTAPHGEIPQLALQKLKQCCRSIDFSDKQTEAASKITKKATLNELIDCYNNPKMFSRLTRECHQQLIEMFAANVFRPQPNIPRAIIMSDDAVYVDTAWSHLNLVYILFQKFLDCDIDQRILQFKLDPKFISSLFAILDFPDERERIQAKMVIAKIHAKVPPQRKILYQLTLNLLLSVPEGFEMNAASHLLDLFYTFTSSTPPPLPQSLLQAFEKVLLPLHLPERCQRYFNSLVRCTMMLVRKDIRLGNSLIHFLVEHWPLTLDHKSELFIEEISHLLDESMPKCIDQNIEEVLRFICISAESSCTTLANKALKFMLNNRIQNLIVEKPEKLLSIIFPTLFRIARGHWQRNLQLSALNVMNALVELVPAYFTQAAARFKEDVLAEEHRKEEKKKLWESVAQIAIEKDHTIDAEAVNCEFTDFYGEGKELPSYLLQARLNYRRHNLKGRSGSVIDLSVSQNNQENIFNDDEQDESNTDDNKFGFRMRKLLENKSDRKNKNTRKRMIHQQRSTPLMMKSIEKSPISFPTENAEEEGYPLVNSRSMPKLASTPQDSASDSEVSNDKKENDIQDSNILQDENSKESKIESNDVQNADSNIEQPSNQNLGIIEEQESVPSTTPNSYSNQNLGIIEEQESVPSTTPNSYSNQNLGIIEEQEPSTTPNLYSNQNLDTIEEQESVPSATPNLYSNQNLGIIEESAPSTTPNLYSNQNLGIIEEQESVPSATPNLYSHQNLNTIEEQESAPSTTPNLYSNQNLGIIEEQESAPSATPNLYSHQNSNSSLNQNINPNVSQTLNQKFNQNPSFGSNLNLGASPINKATFSSEFFPSSSDIKNDPYKSFGNSLMKGSNPYGSSFNTNVSLFDDNEAIKEEDEDQYSANQQQNNLLTIIEE